ncbi:MAG: DUF2815 family protein [Oscillospiraceae bacterium]|nr:DUF2815 family protein [Oscillospiraceae bacterium]
MANETQLTTGKVRFSFLHAFEPAPNKTGQLKYSATILIPKSDKATLQKMQTAAQAARDNFLAKRGKKIPIPKGSAVPGLPTVWDGDGERPNGEPFGPECAGHYVVTVSSNRKPLIVYSDKTEITAEEELYSGCYGKVIINAFGYANESVGVTFGLNGIMKLEDGEPIGGVVIKDTDWDSDFDEII